MGTHDPCNKETYQSARHAENSGIGEENSVSRNYYPQFSFGLQSEVLKMSAAVVEAAPAPPNPANPVIEEIQENRDKLGDLVDKMDNVKINENGVADPEKIKERLGIDPEQTIGFNIHNEEKA